MTRRPILAPLALAAGLGAALTGCGSSPAPTPAAATMSVCATTARLAVAVDTENTQSLVTDAGKLAGISAPLHTGTAAQQTLGTDAVTLAHAAADVHHRRRQPGRGPAHLDRVQADCNGLGQ